MKHRFAISRLAVWGVVAALVAAAFLLAQPRPGAAQDPVIDTAAPIEQSQCAPCHLDLAEVDQPGLIFSHGNHLFYSCDACHQRMPHRDGVTEKIPMETCFACHGVQHGPQGELATGECSQCHTPSFTLRPKSHSADWAKKPHAQAGIDQGVNGCMMCHDAPKDCDECHVREKVDVEPMPNAYHPMIQPKEKGPSVKIYPDGEASMSQCVFCHPDLDEITPGRIIFAHAAHLQRNYDCKACHASFAHDEQGVQKPDMLSCYRCHSVYHNGGGQIADGKDCLMCHPKSFELRPVNHTQEFVKGKHKVRASRDPAYCAMCHPSEFCTECHRSKAVIPADHKRAQWKSVHGPRFLDGKGACGVCHTDESCKRCHKTVMPHPVGWIENHKPEPGIPAEDCNVCHTDRNTCQKCHHQSVGRGELVKINCAEGGPGQKGCHPEMNTNNPTAIKNKGFAEHAVHFEVHKKSVGGGTPKDKPYTCDDCHIGYTTNLAASGNGMQGTVTLPAAGHDIRLCYTCHGSVDYQNTKIAPWPGAELCIRCHSDMNI